MYDVKARLVEMADGSRIEHDVLHIVERISEIWPHLCVKYLDPNSPANLTSAPYAVFELCPDGIERKVFNVWELDQRVIDKLTIIDTFKNPHILEDMDKHNASVEAKKKADFNEKNSEVTDVMTHMLNNPKTTYSFELDNKHITVSDDPKSQAKVVVKD